MKRIIIPILFAICFLAQNMRAQELNFTVTVNTKQVSGTDQRIYEALQEGMMNFMNNRIWTNINLNSRNVLKERWFWW